MAEEGPLMEGYLLKWTNYMKGFQRRYFVLERGILSYYKCVLVCVVMFSSPSPCSSSAPREASDSFIIEILKREARRAVVRWF